MRKIHRSKLQDFEIGLMPDSIQTTKLPALQGVSFWAQKDLNLRPTDYESDALTN